MSEERKQGKSKTIGYMAKSKTNPTGRYIKINEDVTLKKGQFVQLFKPRKSEKQTDEQFAEIVAWKLADAVVFTDDSQ